VGSLITRSIVHLLEETGADNRMANELLGYIPEIHWKEAVHRQITEMQRDQFTGMKMFKPIKPLSISTEQDPLG